MREHAWGWERCEVCGAGRDDCVRAERERVAREDFRDEQVDAYEALRGRWLRGDTD